MQHNLISRYTKNVLHYLGANHLSVNGSIITHDKYLGQGYGLSNPATIQAVKQCAELEGVLLDPVYTGKAMAGLMDLCHSGEFAKNSNILFIHTGGSAGLFAYAEVFG